MALFYKYLAWKEGPAWTAHAPAIPGAYGVGRSRAEAVKDLGEMIELLGSYLHEVGEPMPKAVVVVVGRIAI